MRVNRCAVFLSNLRLPFFVRATGATGAAGAAGAAGARHGRGGSSPSSPTNCNELTRISLWPPPCAYILRNRVPSKRVLSRGLSRGLSAALLRGRFRGVACSARGLCVGGVVAASRVGGEARARGVVWNLNRISLCQSFSRWRVSSINISFFTTIYNYFKCIK